MVHYKIVLSSFSVYTLHDVPKILEYGRTAAGFITVVDTHGHRKMINVAHILAVIEVKPEEVD